MSSLVATIASAVALSHTAVAGPAIAGDAVLWGEKRAPDGLVLKEWKRGGRPRALRRIPALPGKRRYRDFGGVPGGVSGSERWKVYVRVDSHVTAQGSDFSASTGTARPFASRDGGPFRQLVPECPRGAFYLSTAADGDTVVVGMTDSKCAGVRRDGRVWLVDGDEPARLIHESGGGVIHVEIEGPWIAWAEGQDRDIAVAERATGKVVARYTAKDFQRGARGIDSFGIDAAGNVAAATGPQPRCYYACVTVRNVDGSLKRTLTRRASDVEIADGRVAWVTARRDDPRGHIKVVGLDGRSVGRYGRFNRRRSKTAELALSETRLAWATTDPRRGGDPRADGSIHVVDLPGRPAPGPR